MTLESIVLLALDQKASDVHLEPRLPITIRIHGSLRRLQAIPDESTLRKFARHLLSEEDWGSFQARGSVDLSRVIGGVQCRINILKSDRGVGFAIRLLASSVNSLASCNLHPSLAQFLERDSGLIILTGPTGSGKTTTLSAMLEEINHHQARHIITLESPIEYRLAPKKSIIRQREVGVHTPSFEQGLIDSLREDPDVLVVGEMREPEAMRLTLNASETGHLVLATMHSGTAMDAVYRMMMSFPPERQSSVLAQIADTLIAVISHKMTFREQERILVPTCEVLVANHAVRNVIRKGDVSKFPSLLQTGGPEGMWTFDRYQSWLDAKSDWQFPKAPVPITDPIGPVGHSIDPDDAVDVINALDNVNAMDHWDPKPRASLLPTRETTTAQPSGAKKRVRAAIEAKDRNEANASAGDSKAAPVESITNPTSAPTAGKKDKKSGAMRIHKDGRIEIPEMDLDLDELVKEYKGRGES